MDVVSSGKELESATVRGVHNALCSVHLFSLAIHERQTAIFKCRYCAHMKRLLSEILSRVNRIYDTVSML